MPEQNMFKRGDVYWLRAEVKGHKYRESLHTSDVKTARRARDARLKQIASEVHHGERSHSWKEAVIGWTDFISGQLSKSTLKRYGVSLAQCEPYLSPFPVGKIDRETLMALTNARRKAKATPATIRRDLTAISRVMDFAEASGWREGNPTLSMRRLLKERRDPIELPTEAAYAEVLAASSERFSALIVAARLSGCRQNELVTVTHQQFDRSTHTLEVIGKGNKRRTILLSAAAAAHWEAQVPVKGSRLIFCREDGSAFTEAASDYTHFRRKALAANPEHKRFRFHDLRHLFAVEALRDGMSIYSLSKHLGHTSVKTTEIYLEFLKPADREIAREGGRTQGRAQEGGWTQNRTQSTLDTVGDTL